MVRVVFPPGHNAVSVVESAGVVELLGVVSTEGFTEGARVEEPGLQHDGVVPGVAVDTCGLPRVRTLVTDLGNTENAHLTRLHLPTALAPDVSVRVGPAGQLKPGPTAVFELRARDPVDNRPSNGLVARGPELEVALHLTGVRKLWQLVVQVWAVSVPSEDKIRRWIKRINCYLTYFLDTS